MLITQMALIIINLTISSLIFDYGNAGICKAIMTVDELKLVTDKYRYI